MILTDELRALIDVPRYGMKAPEPTWEQIDAELGKGEQMGYQTVLQFATVGQMLKVKMGDMSLREFAASVPCVGQHVRRLSRSTIHRYLTLADNLPLLEQKQPESLNAAVALIADTKRPPAPVVTPAPKAVPTPVPSQDDAKWEAVRDGENKAQNMFDNYVAANFAHFEQLLKFGEGLHELFNESDSDDMSEFLALAAEKTGADESDIEFAMTLAEKFESLRGRLTVNPVPAPKERDADAEFIRDRLASAERLELEALNEYAKSI